MLINEKYNSGLKYLNKNETGYGILVESDSGFIDPHDLRNKPFISEIQKLGENASSVGKVMVEPLVLFVILQKYDVVNKNGRIYPKHILMREANNYQKLIEARSAIGECVPKHTQIYTKDGWKEIQEVMIGENIFTLNTQTNKLEIQEVLKTTEKDYNDDMVSISNNSSLDMLVTKKHKIVLWDRNDKPYILTAEELHHKIKNNDSKVNHSYIKHSGTWSGYSPDTIKIPNSDYEIDSKLWAAFLGIFLADGHTSGSKGGQENNITAITQIKEDSKSKIIELLNLLPFKYKIVKHQMVIRDKALFQFMKQLGNSETKYIPQYAKDWSVDLLEILLEWMLLGDGRNRKDTKGNILREYYSISEKLSNDVFEVMLKVSNGATISKRIQKDRYITDYKLTEDLKENGEIVLNKTILNEKRLIKSENSKILNITSERTSKGIYLDSRFIKTELIPFNDKVYCVTVQNGTWLMKYNDKISWTHNSDHPDSSIISNTRISHEIKKIWWEGQTLVGEIEIIMSPGFINLGIISCEGDRIANYLRKGIRVGVSSRGVGSLDDRNGKLMVQDDFELICWDIVTSPSTPGSYMFSNQKEAMSFMESEVKQKSLLVDKLNNFLIK